MLQLHSEHQRRTPLQAEAGGGPEIRSDNVVAFKSGHKGPEGLTVAVGEILVTAELLDGRHIVVQHCIAHPHCREGVDAADAQVLGKPLHHPQW